jgi:hypothetical protein
MREILRFVFYVYALSHFQDRMYYLQHQKMRQRTKLRILHLALPAKENACNSCVCACVCVICVYQLCYQDKMHLCMYMIGICSFCEKRHGRCCSTSNPVRIHPYIYQYHHAQKQIFKRTEKCSSVLTCTILAARDCSQHVLACLPSAAACHHKKAYANLSFLALRKNLKASTLSAFTSYYDAIPQHKSRKQARKQHSRRSHFTLV